MTSENISQPIPQPVIKMAICLGLLKQWNRLNHHEDAVMWLYSNYSEMGEIVKFNEAQRACEHAMRLIVSGVDFYALAKYVNGENARHQMLGLAVALAWYWNRPFNTSNNMTTVMDSFMMKQSYDSGDDVSSAQHDKARRQKTLNELCHMMELDADKDIAVILTKFYIT